MDLCRIHIHCNWPCIWPSTGSLWHYTNYVYCNWQKLIFKACKASFNPESHFFFFLETMYLEMPQSHLRWSVTVNHLLPLVCFCRQTCFTLPTDVWEKKLFKAVKWQIHCTVFITSLTFHGSTLWASLSLICRGIHVIIVRIDYLYVHMYLNSWKENLRAKKICTFALHRLVEPDCVELTEFKHCPWLIVQWQFKQEALRENKPQMRQLTLWALFTFRKQCCILYIKII